MGSLTNISQSNQNNAGEIKYSNDKKLYVGMRVAENINEQQMSIFNKADKDGDGVLTEQEILRYNAINDKLCAAKNNIEYYPGLSVENIQKKWQRRICQN